MARGERPPLGDIVQEARLANVQKQNDRLPLGAFVEQLDDTFTADEDLERLRAVWSGGFPQGRGKTKPSPSVPKQRGRHLRKEFLSKLSAVHEATCATSASDSASCGTGAATLGICSPVEQDQGQWCRRVWGGAANPRQAMARLKLVEPSSKERLRLLGSINSPCTPALSMTATSLDALDSEFGMLDEIRSDTGSSRSIRTSAASQCPSHKRHAVVDGGSWVQKWERVNERDARQEARRCAWEEAVAMRNLRLALAQRRSASVASTRQPSIQEHRRVSSSGP